MNYLLGYTHIINYHYVLITFIVANIIGITEHYIAYKNEVFAPDTRYLKPKYNRYFPLSYISKNIYINIFFFIIICSNFLLINNTYYKVILLIQYWFYYHLTTFTTIIDSRMAILKYIIFIFLISPNIYNENIIEIPSYGLFFLNYKLMHIYFSAGINKVKTEAWKMGYSMRYTLCSYHSIFNGYIIPRIISEIICYSTLFWELIGCTFLWNPNLYKWAIVFGFIFHLSIGLLMPHVSTYHTNSLVLITSFIYIESNSIQYITNPIMIILLYSFFIIQIINDGVDPKSQLRHPLIIKFLKILRLNDNGRYKLFGYYYSTLNEKYSIQLTNNNNKTKYEIIQLDIQMRSGHRYVSPFLDWDNTVYIDWDREDAKEDIINGFQEKFQKSDTKTIKLIIEYEYINPIIHNNHKYYNIYGNIYELNKKYPELIKNNFIEINIL